VDVTRAIHERRAFRSLDPAEVGEALARDLAAHAQLAPTCNNNQPARFVFAWEPGPLAAVKDALNKGNAWARAASMIVAVLSEREMDCLIRDREYWLFDTGMQTALLILRATELGLVAHPIAGFKPELVRAALGIPETLTVEALVIVGRHSATISPVLSESQVRNELKRPERLPLEEVAYFNRYSGPEEAGK
jgi:nitroreductase